jgi:hypothetical protein
MQTFGFTGLVFVIVLIFYEAIKTISGYDMAQRITFFIGVTAGSFFLASFIFGQFSSNASGSSFLTLPASAFEKWLCGILVAGILYPVVFVAFYRAMDTVFVLIYHHSLNPASPFYKRQYESVYLFDLKGVIARNVYIMSLLYTGAMLVGSLYFNKLAVIKVALTLSGIFIVVFGLNWVMAIGLFGPIEDASPFHHVALRTGNDIGSIELPWKAGILFGDMFLYLFPLLLWLLAFTRLREKEF